ncbi:MAG: MBOAT family protein [Bacteroidales bacterium]|nr:MBOAT family protein [Bacteroidales bacterium]
MTFASIEYLIFLPVVFLLYWIVCRRNKNLQNGLIVLASLFFYGFWDWRFLGLLLVTAFSTFFAGLWMNRVDDRKRWWISFGTIVLNLGILFGFKYYNFFVQAFVDSFSLLGKELSVSTLKIILPVGISFYTFTALSYSIDVYQRKVEATKDVVAYLAFVTFFPSILSGPISRATKQLPQYLKRREFSYDTAVSSCRSILWGGVLKLCLADRLGIYVDAVYGNIANHNGTTLLLTSILYTIQIYADFAGYSLMAIGSGKLLGIELPENFVRPYFAKTVTEFWRRWHISLTTWFRDYIYFPLGGNRVKRIRWMLNTMIVFTVSGLWHGAEYTFIIWGAFHGLCMIVERLIYGNKIKEISDRLTLLNIVRMVVTFCIVSFAWIFFRAENFADASMIVGKIFTSHGSVFTDPDTMVYSFGFLLLVFVADFLTEFCGGRFQLLNNKHTVVRWVTYLAMIVMILLFGVLDGGSFIYFQF